MSLDSIELAGRFLEASGLPVTTAIRAGDEGYRIGLEEQRCGSTG